MTSCLSPLFSFFPTPLVSFLPPSFPRLVTMESCTFLNGKPILEGEPLPDSREFDFDAYLLELERQCLPEAQTDTNETAVHAQDRRYVPFWPRPVTKLTKSPASALALLPIINLSRSMNFTLLCFLSTIKLPLRPILHQRQHSRFLARITSTSCCNSLTAHSCHLCWIRQLLSRPLQYPISPSRCLLAHRSQLKNPRRSTSPSPSIQPLTSFRYRQPNSLIFGYGRRLTRGTCSSNPVNCPRLREPLFNREQLILAHSVAQLGPIRTADQLVHRIDTATAVKPQPSHRSGYTNSNSSGTSSRFRAI